MMNNVIQLSKYRSRNPEVMETNDSFTTLKISHQQLEDVIVAHLLSLGVIRDADVTFIDLGLAVDDEEMVEMDIYYGSLT